MTRIFAAAAVLGTLLGSAALAQTVYPVAPVPRFGPGSPVYNDSAPPPRYVRSRTARLGRAGPVDTMMPSGQVGPNCMTPLWRAGFHANHVDCPLYLPTRPGANQQCTASDAAGRVRSLTVTFLDWNPATNLGTIDCTLNRRR